MCGIAGFFGSFSEQHLKSMMTKLSHRGPDDEGIEIVPVGDVVVGLGHRRLSIIDLEGGRQPMWNTDRSALIVFNGEIYNYRELRCELEARGHQFQTHSDTEVILEGWREWGEKVLPRLSGMFAFAIWDQRQQVLFLARDRFGIKPLYFTWREKEHFIFASEIKPLLPYVNGAKVHFPALWDYLLHGWSGLTETFFEGIQQLPPASAMLWKAAEKTLIQWRYWHLQPNQHISHDWPDALRDALDRSVQSHLVADVPVGIMLSGGLDSSAVLASMIQYLDATQLKAYCVGYGLSDDELPFARSVARHCNILLREKVGAVNAFANNFARCILSLEEPIAHPMMQTTYQLSEFVGSHGKVVLMGEGSDELFAGYPEFKLFTFPYKLAPQEMRRKAFMAVCCLMPTANQLHKMLVPGLQNIDLLTSLESRFDRYFESSIEQGALTFELEQALPFNQLSRVDKLSMAHSIEARVPFLDHKFAELAMSIPLQKKIGNGMQKRVLREAMVGRLPQEIIYRPKTGKKGTQALLPTMMNLVRNGSLSHLISRESLGKRGWFNPDAVLNYLDQEKKWTVRHHPIEFRRRAKFSFALAVLEQWARIFLDGEVPDTVESFR